MTAPNAHASEEPPAPGPVRSVAFYLPQFHPIPENDGWWEPGFTEWTNVAKARRRFPGHYQPRLPGELGFYDLRLPETREAQAQLARDHGVTAFCYWHYWFGNGRTILDRPFREVLESGQPDFPFCVGWANGSWTGIWHGAPRRTLVEQTYPGDDDYRRHFDLLLPALSDRRYLRIEGKPLLFLFKPPDIPDLARFTDLWRRLGEEAGLGELFLAGQTGGTAPPANATALDAWVSVNVPGPHLGPGDIVGKISRNLLRIPRVCSYRRYVESPPALIDGRLSYPCVIPGWDNTPRSGVRGVVLHGAAPDLFRIQVETAVRQIADREPEHRILFVKSWNEWAEGNYLEPDRKDGRAFLEAFRDAVTMGSPIVS